MANGYVYQENEVSTLIIEYINLKNGLIIGKNYMLLIYICSLFYLGAIVMEMPRRAGKHGRFMANSSSKLEDEYCEIVCRVIPIMDRLFSKRSKLALNQVIY